jgi:hypothetical protein
VSQVNQARYGQPAFIGGLVMGVLSALPLVNMGNACCCLWVLCGGMVAAFLLQQNQTEPITPGDGALVGLLAGLLGAVIQLVVSIPVSLIVGPVERAMAQRFVDMAGNVPPVWREMLDRYDRGGAMGWILLGKLIGLMFWLFIGAIFSTIGGLIGAALFKKTPPASAIAGENIPPA